MVGGRAAKRAARSASDGAKNERDLGGIHGRAVDDEAVRYRITNAKLLIHYADSFSNQSRSDQRTSSKVSQTQNSTPKHSIAGRRARAHRRAPREPARRTASVGMEEGRARALRRLKRSSCGLRRRGTNCLTEECDVSYGSSSDNQTELHPVCYLTPRAFASTFTATDDRLRNPDQLRRSTVAHPAHQRQTHSRTLASAG